MQFWPLAVVVFGALLVALALMALMMRMQRANVSSKGPRHRWNKQTDLANAAKRQSVDRTQGTE